MIERCSNDRLGINRIHVIVWSRFAPPVLLLSKRRKSHQDLIRPFVTWVRCKNKASRDFLRKPHFGRHSTLSKTFFWDKDPHFLSPNPHFITWETNISIECNQDQSKYTSHKYPRVFPRELSLCREWWRYENYLAPPKYVVSHPSLSMFLQHGMPWNPNSFHVFICGIENSAYLCHPNLE